MTDETKPRVYVRGRAFREAFKPKMSNAQYFALLADGTIPSVKVGGMRIPTITPDELIERHLEPKPAV